MAQSDLTRLCKNCEHYRVTAMLRRKVCAVPAKWQLRSFLITGKLIHAVSCSEARQWRTKCGEDAQHFVEITTVP